MDYSNLDNLNIEWDGDKVHIGPREAEVRDFLEYLKPKLGTELTKYLDVKPEEEQRKDFIKALEGVFERYKEEPQKHIKIDVTATQEEINEHKMTVIFTALDDIGAEWVREMEKCQQN